MKNLQNILIILAFALSATVNAQQDTLKLQREARALLRDGNKLYNKEKYSDAAIAYRKALGKNSKYEKASYNFGNTLYQEKKYKEAIEQFEVTTKTSKNKIEQAEAYHNIGNAMMEEKQYEQAVEAYKNALRRNPNDDETRYNLAVAQKEAKKQEQNKQNNNDNKNKNNPDDKDIKPSEYAKSMKQKADNALNNNDFSKALSLMKEALSKDQTTKHYQDYIKRLEDINQIIK
ncbi:tetratricopeptide repeat protein [uncultured Tenacibaculum sp.]|uniref:tetratricopeptide repeat protein n=1 Tax=uncultured Tenacibaculum sp. TaxID=174713 RepID=UPI0026374C80|nr:tetratricopeptide repeat protein [uncultured Tenacibaculum sp.]